MNDSDRTEYRLLTAVNFLNLRPGTVPIPATSQEIVDLIPANGDLFAPWETPEKFIQYGIQNGFLEERWPEENKNGYVLTLKGHDRMHALSREIDLHEPLAEEIIIAVLHQAGLEQFKPDTLNDVCDAAATRFGGYWTRFKYNRLKSSKTFDEAFTSLSVSDSVMRIGGTGQFVNSASILGEYGRDVYWKFNSLLRQQIYEVARNFAAS